MLHKLLLILLSLPRTVWFNFRYLPFKQAVKIPIWLASNVRLKKMYRGGIVLKNIAFNSCHIGFHCADAVDTYGVHTILCVEHGGKLLVESDLHIGRGAIIHVKTDATLSLGRNFAISGTTSIICSKEITVGDDVQFSWNSLVMDSDAHMVFDVDGNLTNYAESITIGNKVWIAANTTILKKSVIGNNCVVAGNSLVNKPLNVDNHILAGTPAKPIRPISRWQI